MIVRNVSIYDLKLAIFVYVVRIIPTARHFREGDTDHVMVFRLNVGVCD